MNKQNELKKSVGNKPETTQSLEPKKEMTLEKVKEAYCQNDMFVGDKNMLSEYRDLHQKLDKLTPNEKKRKDQLSTELFMTYGLENGIWATNLGHSKYYSSLAQIRLNIVKDYDCKSSLELMLADRIVAHYWRAMRNDTLLNRYIENGDGSFSINQLKINMIREFNNGTERADRQLNADIILLKELKQPKLNIKVTTENAFIAQNQQVNAGSPNNENIQPK